MKSINKYEKQFMSFYLQSNQAMFEMGLPIDL